MFKLFLHMSRVLVAFYQLGECSWYNGLMTGSTTFANFKASIPKNDLRGKGAAEEKEDHENSVETTKEFRYAH